MNHILIYKLRVVRCSLKHYSSPYRRDRKLGTGGEFIAAKNDLITTKVPWTNMFPAVHQRHNRFYIAMNQSLTDDYLFNRSVHNSETKPCKTLADDIWINSAQNVPNILTNFHQQHFREPQHSFLFYINMPNTSGSQPKFQQEALSLLWLWIQPTLD